MLSKEEYVEYYETRGKTIDQIAKPNKPLNDRQLSTKFSKYYRKEEKRLAKPLFKIDERWEETKRLVEERDKGTCQLISKLPTMEQLLLIRNSSGFHKILDPAHRLGKGAYPKLKYKVTNVFTLNRYSHSMLDAYKHPIKGYSISKQDHNLWWQIITNEITYEEAEWQEKV